MADADYIAFAAFLLGAFVGWVAHALILQVAYRIGIVRWVGRASTKESNQ